MMSSHRIDHVSVESPIFVLGNPRSGTTLLRLILTAHPKIGIPPESEFIVALFKRYGAVRSFDPQTLEALKSDVSGGLIDLTMQWNSDIKTLFQDTNKFLGRDYAGVCALLYREYQTVLGFEGKVVWGDKNNAYGNYIDVLNYLYPHARYIHLVRDGRAVLNSYKNLNFDPSQRYAPILSKEARNVARQWVDMTGRIDRHLARFASDRHLVVRYEDLMWDFEGETARICDFLELDFDPSMRRFDELNRRFDLEPREYGWKENTFKPLAPEKSESWRKKLTEEDISVFEAEAGRQLSRYHYRLVSAAGSARRSGWPSKTFLSGRLRETLRAGRLSVIKVRTRAGL